MTKVTLEHGRRRGQDRGEGARQRDRGTDAHRASAQVRRARKSIAGFKIREGMPIGARVTLRGDRMYDFSTVLLRSPPPAHPRLRGLNSGSFDGRGNYRSASESRSSSPRIDYDDISSIRGLDVAVTTTATTDEQDSRRCADLGSRSPASRETDRSKEWQRSH